MSPTALATTASPPTATVQDTEYQAVVLAGGRGSRMTDVTGSKAKCLLPVGGFPVLFYPLNTLRKIGFKEVIVVTLEAFKTDVAALPKKFGLDGLSLDIVTYPTNGATGGGGGDDDEEGDEDNEEDLGTADAIRLVHHKLTSAKRVMVVSGDLVTDFSVNYLTDLHTLHHGSVTALYTKQDPKFNPKSIPVPGPKTKFKKESREFVGIDPANQQLCFLASEADLDEVLTLRKSVLREHPRIAVHTDLIDAHFYIFDKWVCDLIKTDDRLSSIRGEVLPYLVKKQFSRKAIVRSDDLATSSLNDTSTVVQDETPNGAKKEGMKGIDDYLERLENVHLRAESLSSWNPRPGDLQSSYKDRILRCFAYVLDGSGSTGNNCVRVNTLYNFVDLNRKAEKVKPAPQNVPNVHPNSKVDPNATLGEECFVGEGTVIAERTTIKNCVIGSGCVIDPKLRLTDCIIMDNVHVRSFANVTGSFLCDNAVIGEKVTLKNSIVGKNIEIPDGENHANEILATDDSRMMEI